VIASAVAEGLQARAGQGGEKPEVEAEPLPEWEQELLAEATAATSEAPAEGQASTESTEPQNS